MQKNRLRRSGLILVIAFMLSAAIAVAQISSYRAHETAPPAEGIALGGTFTVQDQNGAPFSDKDLLGHYSLIYFGFTSCPAVCPTELQKMTVALNQAGAAAEQIALLFITIDPERDTQKAMAAYVAQFSPRLRGLTGTQAQIDQAEKAFHVYARKVEDPKLSEYTMDHSSYIYLMGKDGRIMTLFGPSSTAAEISAAIKKATSS